MAPESRTSRDTAPTGMMPRSTVSTPTELNPAIKAAASMGPDRRVSCPTTTFPSRPSPAARARSKAISGVSPSLATPRTPSVPKRCLSAIPDTPMAIDVEQAQRLNQRFVNCGARRALRRPYFLRSTLRSSRRSSPAFFSAGRRSGSISTSARAIPSRRASL